MTDKSDKKLAQLEAQLRRHIINRDLCDQKGLRFTAESFEQAAQRTAAEITLVLNNRKKSK